MYWGFTPAGLDAMARHAGFEGFELIDAPVIDGHPRVIGALAPVRGLTADRAAGTSSFTGAKHALSRSLTARAS